VTRDLYWTAGQPEQREDTGKQVGEVDSRPAATPRPDHVRAPMIASNFRVVEKNTLLGFFTLAFPSGQVLHEYALDQKGTQRWISLPVKPVLDADGRQRRDANGKRRYTPVVEIPDKIKRERFQQEALAAVDRLLGKEKRP
jgi:hypothetical protein